MDDTASTPPRGLKWKITRTAQWIVFAILVLFAIVVVSEIRKAGVPGAPLALLYGCIAVWIAVAVAHLPPVFFRLPGKASWLAYLSIIPALFLFGFYASAMNPAWAKTPEGAKEMAERAERDKRAETEAKREAEDRAAQEKTARDLAEMNAAVEQLAEIKRKLERCFTFGGRLPALENPVRESLHNPGAFEHVETMLIVPDADRNNVVMRFRAQNGFGALRTAEVRAQLIADDCSIQNIGTPQID